MPENTVNVTRPGYFGNPFKLGQTINGTKDLFIDLPDIPLDTKEKVLLAYRFWLDNTELGGNVKKAAREVLKGHNLACFCKEGDPCHADILLEIANQ